MKKDENIVTCGMVIKSAREEKEMTINDLAFEISKDKEKIKLYEKKIMMWEKDKDYPNMEEIYLLANTIGINPTDIIILRNRYRKTLDKTNTKRKYKKIDWDELKEYLYYIASFLGKVVAFLGIIAFSVVYCKLVGVSLNGPSGAEGFDREVGNVITDYMNSINEINNENINNDVNNIYNDNIIENEIL